MITLRRPSPQSGNSRRSRRIALAPSTLALIALLFSHGHLAYATPPVVAPISDSDTPQPGDPGYVPPPKRPPFFEGIERRSYFLGDIFGLREKLAKHGISLGIAETSEVLGNLTGGVQRGFEYDGLTQIAAQLDTARAYRHYGGTFNVSALQVHGNNLSSDNLDSLQTASGIEADRSTRLWELWYQQKYLAEDRLDVKIGQQSLDQEFMNSQNAGIFVNTMFGWAMVPSADLPGGGPAYPLSALGVRLRGRPTDTFTYMAGIFNGSPVTSNNGDPQQLDNHGTRFPLNGGTLAIAELQFIYPGLGSMVYADQAAPLSRIYKVGAYYDSEEFADESLDSSGRSLANPSSGDPALHRGNYGLYGVADQMVWISPEDPDRTLSVFGRAMTQPQNDRNLISYSLNAGFVLHDPIPKIQRDDDTFGVAMGYAKVGDGAADLDRASNDFSDSPVPVRSGETFIETTYQYQYTPWCQIQPDIQYVINPGAGVTGPNGSRVGDELVIGTRVNLLF